MDELISKQEALAFECENAIEQLQPKQETKTSHWNIPFLIHKELEIPIYEAQKAYEVAIDYLRSQAHVRG